MRNIVSTIGRLREADVNVLLLGGEQAREGT